MWPVFLLISQKYLLIYDIIFGTRRKVFNRGVILAACMFVGSLLLSILTLFLEYNSFSLSHFVGYFVFLIYSLVLGSYLASRSELPALHVILTRLNVISLSLLFVIYFLELDLTRFRGLNFIRGNDGEVHRFFVETSALFLMSNFEVIRNKLFRLLFWIATFCYFVFVAKITLLILLFIILYMWKWFRLRPGITLILVVGALVVVFLSGYHVYFIREDLILSILYKIDQFKFVVSNYSTEHLIFGSGFGYYLSEFVTDYSQPYQIEMQLPMLILQIGLLNVVLIILGFYFLFNSIAVQGGAGFGLFLFIAIGFINPWMFLPVWFISVCFYTILLFDDKDNRISLHS
jgi:hypothetical protein